MKKLLLLVLDFLRWQIAHDRLDIATLAALGKAIAKSVCVYATTEDVAAFFGKTENNVRVVASRNVGEKPHWRKCHNFVSFVKKMPESWAESNDA